MSTPFAGHWEQLGTGTPILCISGFASSNWMLHDLLAPLRNQGCFILPDNRGMGRSPLAPTGYRLQDLAADYLQLMDDLGHEQFAIIGLSMGGFVAQLLTQAAPHRVKRLVLLCTSSAGESFKALFPIMPRQQVADLYHLPPEARIRAALSLPICPLLSVRYPEVYEEVVRKRLVHQENVEQVLLQYDAVLAFLDSHLDLAAIACPTLVLAGDQDLMVPLANAHLLAERIPNAQLTVIPDTDHLFFLEKQAEVSHHIAQFLARDQNH
ncbi:MAG: alpha/beta hydrolase [Magnetococcales bacterium]|nr:alpha/beta hydrolase [Magnetococcales bacterium]